jgi:FAD/FMN-containing dehydrogenase
LEASDPGYDAARAIHNGLIDKRPMLIAKCLNTADSADAVRWARSEGLEISVRGGGHNPAGNAVTSGGLMISLAPMRGTYVDPVRRRARVQGGANWSDYNRATAGQGSHDGRYRLDDRRGGLDSRRWNRLVDGPLRHRVRQPEVGRTRDR